MGDVVLDASVLTEVLVGRVTVSEYDGWHVHSGIDLEVLSALRRMVRLEEVPANIAREAIDVFRTLEMARHPVLRLASRIWTLRHDVSAYDAGYVALAEALGIPLVTLDRKLAKTASRYCDVMVP